MQLSLARFIKAFLMSVMLFTDAFAGLPETGSQAPDFALKSNPGINVRLSEYRGEVVLLTFWASWCRSCRTAIPKLIEMHGANTADDFHIVGISLDDDRNVTQRVSAEMNITFPVLSDDRHNVAELYDLPDVPVTLLVDRTGTIRFIHRGFESGDEQLYASEAAMLLSE